jgi:hypothetical protein
MTEQSPIRSATQKEHIKWVAACFSSERSPVETSPCGWSFVEMFYLQSFDRRRPT